MDHVAQVTLDTSERGLRIIVAMTTAYLPAIFFINTDIPTFVKS